MKVVKVLFTQTSSYTKLTRLNLTQHLGAMNCAITNRAASEKHMSFQVISVCSKAIYRLSV